SRQATHSFPTRRSSDLLLAKRPDVARYVHDLKERPGHRGRNVVSFESGVGLANATLQQRLVAVRLFYDYLMEEGRCDTNPVGRRSEEHTSELQSRENLV